MVTAFYIDILEAQARLRAPNAPPVPITVHDIYHELMWQEADIGYRDFRVHPLRRLPGAPSLPTLEGITVRLAAQMLAGVVAR